MKFRDIYEGKKQLTDEQIEALQLVAEALLENEMKFQALAMAKELHNKLAGLTFIDMLAVMSPDNPAKKEVQNLETAINALTSEVGEFIQKYIPDVADADVGDTEEYAEPEEPEESEEPKDAPEEPEEEPEEELSKDQKKKIKDNEKEVTESVQLNEFMIFDAKDALKDFNGKGKVAKITSDQKVTAKVMPVRGNSFDTDDGYVPVLKNFSRKGKTETITLKAGQEVAIDTARGNVYGMVGDKFFFTSTGNVELNESINEASPVQDFKTLMYKTMYGKEYEMACKMMQDEGISAADAAKRFKHVDARALAELHKKY